MAYTPQNWVNEPDWSDGDPELEAGAFNHLEAGVKATHDAAAAAQSTANGKANPGDIPDVSGLATKEEIPDVSGFALKSEIPEVPDISGKADKSEIPDVSGLASQADLNAAIERIAALEPPAEG